MKCATCGLPLSPNRAQANCPRCGAPTNSPAAQKAPAGAAQSGFFAPAAFNPASPHYTQSPIPPALEPGQGWPAGIREQAGFAPLAADQVGQPRWQPSPPRNNRNNRMGFMIAGLCILAGALLLVFVYFMAIGVNQNNGTTSGTQTASHPTAIPSPSPTSNPSPTATPFPGQQYIDNAQMSSSPPPAQITNTFKANQKIYVIFNLHPNGQTGAVCLVWYLNGQQATSYNFAVSGNSRSSYAYAIFSETGSGSVNIYWANSTSCSNDLLAQQVTFSVTQ